MLEPSQHSAYFQSFYRLLSVTMSYNGDAQIRKTMIEDICMNMNILLGKMIHENLPLQTPNVENFLFLDEVYHHIIKIFEDYREIISEGLALMTTIINYSHSHFFTYVESFMQRFIKPAIDDPNNADLFKVGIESLGYICKRFPKNFKIYINDMTRYIIDNLQDMSIKRSLKVTMFMTLGDFSMSCPNSMAEFVPAILNLCDLALAAAANFMRSNDIEDQLYAIELRDSILDCYLCVVNGMENIGLMRMPEFKQAFIRLQDFIAMTCRKENEPSHDYMKLCLTLLYDSYSRGMDQHSMNVNLVSYLHDVLASGPNDPDLQELLDHVRIRLINS